MRGFSCDDACVAFRAMMRVLFFSMNRDELLLPDTNVISGRRTKLCYRVDCITFINFVCKLQLFIIDYINVVF